MLEPNLYRVRVNSCPDWVAFTSCTLGISVGQPYHEGDKFAATVEWAARHFEQIRVDVSDTLQRHQLIGTGATSVQAANAALREGDRWMTRASPVLTACGRSYTFVRWNAWLQHPLFAEVHDAYSQLATSDAVLSAAVATDIEGFLARRASRGAAAPDMRLMRAASRAYLLEELAVITLQGREER